MDSFLVNALPYIVVFGLLFWLVRSLQADAASLKKTDEGPSENDGKSEGGEQDGLREPTEAEMSRWKKKMMALLVLLIMALVLVIKDCSYAVGLF